MKFLPVPPPNYVCALQDYSQSLRYFQNYCGCDGFYKKLVSLGAITLLTLLWYIIRFFWEEKITFYRRRETIPIRTFPGYSFLSSLKL